MQSNLSVNGYRPTFGIKVNEDLIKAVHNYYSGVEYRPWRAKIFDKRVKEMEETLGYNDFELTYNKGTFYNENTHSLYATKEGMEPVLIAQKDQFRKIIEKLRYLSRRELYTKIHNAQVEQGLK